MSYIDFSIFAIYMIGVFLVGLHFYKKNNSKEDYYVGDRKIGPWHVGLSVAATDVGGGFSIGLGGLGYMIGLSGSWLLFTGLVGAWVSAITIIPYLKKLDKVNNFLTFPDFLRYKYNGKVALLASIITGIGYMGFTGGQILAGAKLSAATLFSDLPIGVDPYLFSVIVIATVIILYTVFGGIKAVIYTDTIQWIILISGLVFFALPFAIYQAGGITNIQNQLPSEFFSLTNVTATDLINWSITILPIWFIAMTLYQRIFSSPNEREAKKAWYIAGLFEYPVMAFAGVSLGMISRIYFPDIDPEMGVPMLLKGVLPIGIKGIIISAYFSAIMSTADSCLIASSGNFSLDIIGRYFYKGKQSTKSLIKLSQYTTLGIGVITLIVAISFESVLEIIYHSYSFMVAGLLVPTLIAFIVKKPNSTAALWAMISGGTISLLIIFMEWKTPYDLHPSAFGIVLSALIYFVISTVTKNNAIRQN